MLNMQGRFKTCSYCVNGNFRLLGITNNTEFLNLPMQVVEQTIIRFPTGTNHNCIRLNEGGIGTISSFFQSGSRLTYTVNNYSVFFNFGNGFAKNHFYAGFLNPCKEVKPCYTPEYLLRGSFFKIDDSYFFSFLPKELADLQPDIIGPNDNDLIPNLDIPLKHVRTEHNILLEISSRIVDIANRRNIQA
ncbi:hypothetical protein EDC39_10632 [Geothermobacter ehrlichii]|uniref:Uncharacterized protein n=1 Tax=Geothermobacter ehrlichii TaxID=213224 RepID=A0A5D3WK38_9BACT|nr:hypothetical protein EDC39_10632 [Geothermobacter ehrlichii]